MTNPMFRLSLALLLGLASLLVRGPAAGSHAAPSAAPWTVFTPVDGSVPMSPNLLVNAGFEDGPAGSADHWTGYSSGYDVDETGGRGGGRALKLVNPVSSELHGAFQIITLDQTERRPIYFSGWSRASSVTGNPDITYSLYLNVHYTDGTSLYARTLTFDTGSHDWQFLEGYILPTKPVARVNVYCFLGTTHSGTAWFDDLSVREVQVELLTFDGVFVATQTPVPPPYGGPELSLATGDGLGLDLAADGGAVTGVTLGGTPVEDTKHLYTGGFFVRDVAGESDFVHVGGSLVQAGNMLTHVSNMPALNLDFTATYIATADRLTIHAEVADSGGGQRALTLYFALPVAATGWTWGDDIRTSREVAGLSEFINFCYWCVGSEVTQVGANGLLSRYPWASLSGPPGGMALSVPLDSPRAMRLVHNPVSNQFYAAFDLGLSPQTLKFPGRAAVDLVLYRFDAEGGFRSAAQGYYDHFPEAFTQRIPPEQEGIWVAFSDLSLIPNVEDFGVAFHELGHLSQVGFDEGAGIFSFRYNAEPWSHWLAIDDPSVDPEDYNQVIAYLQAEYVAGNLEAEATLSSGHFDENGHYVYESTVVPWCKGVAGCAVFTLNPDPDIADPTYPLNKAHLEWNQTTQDLYNIYPDLDGEYVDSFLNHALEVDLRAAHFAATDTPLTYRTSDRRVGLLEGLATTEFARWLAQDVHGNLGKWMMGNAMLVDLPWGADLFDFMGTETNWFRTGSFVPDSDASLSYRRTLAYQRPYGLLMNTNFANLTFDLVERYFQICLFYGIYPSMFSSDGATANYWDDPAFYERDRPLFQRYIPLIRCLNVAGWQPLTYATTSDPSVYIERYGDWPDLHFALRNTAGVAVTVNVTVQADALALPTTPLTAEALLAATLHPLSAPAPCRTLTLTLDPQASEILFLHQADYSVYLPLVSR